MSLQYWNKQITLNGDYPEYKTNGGKHQVIKATNIILKYINKTHKVLDIGCGTGFTTNIYSNHCKEIYGIDYSEEAIRKAREKYKHIKFICAEAVKLPFKNNEFDIIICQGILHHLIDYKYGEYLRNTIKELKRVCKGYILINENNGFNPYIKWLERYYFPKVGRNERSYTFNKWKCIFKREDHKLTNLKYHTFIAASCNKEQVTLLKRFERILENVWFINKLSGAMFFIAENK